MRVIWIAAGLTCVGVGGVGIVIPGLPTTVFFIMAAWCFSRSSERLERWVLNLPGVGSMVSDYRAGLGMPRRAKITAVTCIVLAAGSSALLAIDILWLRITIASLGAVGVWYVGWRVPTRETVQATAPASDPASP